MALVCHVIVAEGFIKEPPRLSVGCTVTFDNTACDNVGDMAATTITLAQRPATFGFLSVLGRWILHKAGDTAICLRQQVVAAIASEHWHGC
jgi:hypothetical protein